MEARKTIENKREGEYIIIKQHVIDIKDEIPIAWICDKLNLCDEDGETAYFDYGLCFDMDGEIWSIEPTKFIKGVSAKLEDNDDYWNIDKEEHDAIMKHLKSLEQFKGYDIYL